MTTIPTVKVSPAEAGRFLITCSRCPRHHTMRSSRREADRAAARHQLAHVVVDRQRGVAAAGGQAAA